MRFDWYQATVAESRDTVTAALASLPGTAKVLGEEGGFGHGFNERWVALDASEDVLASMLVGATQKPNLRASGGSAGPFADWLRASFPNHRVSRVDVAHDQEGQGLFVEWESKIRRVADECGLKSGRKIMPDDPSKGATYYLGAASSEVMTRLYEKGRELRAAGQKDAPEHLVRLEMQWRPVKARKNLAAQMQPREMWGAAKWSAAVLQACVDDRVEWVPVEPVLSRLDEVMQHLIRQYGVTMMRSGAREMRRKHGIVAGQVDPMDAISEVCDKIAADLRSRFEDPKRRADGRDLWDPDNLSFR